MDPLLEDFADNAIKFAEELGWQYCDVRAEESYRHSFLIENGEIQYFLNKYEKGLGIRLFNNKAWEFISISNPKNFDEFKNKMRDATKTAKYYSDKMKNDFTLSPIQPVQDKVEYPVQKEPSEEELLKIGFDCDKAIKNEKKILKSQVGISFNKISKYFTSNEGAKIYQNFTDTVTDLSAIAYESGLTQSVNTTEGGRGGIETLYTKNDIEEVAKKIAKKASLLLEAKPAKEEKTTVVLNPDFVALLTHEILGHPSEADRVLGKEMAWAGGSWWEGKLGEKIGSPILNVFDDPTIKGCLGWYLYDDEGCKSSKTKLVEDGILKQHLQSRETSKIFDSKPTANMRTTSYRYMPLIRMACTCIEKGDWEPEEMISDVKNGILVSNMKIPSIDMRRFNWSISCQYAQKIESGEVTELLRDVIVLGNAPDFFNSIDACGKDFALRPITNCGKGDPMQLMIMGNGGPSVRAQAIVKSVNSNE